MISRKDAKTAKRNDPPLRYEPTLALSCPEGATFSRRSPRKSVESLLSGSKDEARVAVCELVQYFLTNFF